MSALEKLTNTAFTRCSQVKKETNFYATKINVYSKLHFTKN